LPSYSRLYRVGPLTHLKMCAFFSALHCLPRGSSPKVRRFRHFTAKGKSMSELHIFVSAVHCCCQHSKPCRVCARLISQLKFISTLFIYYCTIFLFILKTADTVLSLALLPYFNLTVTTSSLCLTIFIYFCAWLY